MFYWYFLLSFPEKREKEKRKPTMGGACAISAVSESVYGDGE